MRHRLLMIFLGVGAVAGFASGFARLYPHHRYGDACHLHGVERRAAEACTRAALDVLEERKTGQNR